MNYSDIFDFDLSQWQKTALDSISNGDHVLVTAPTGSGKTVPAEYAIHYFTRKQKKIIYTSPIKALSNQKYFEFQQKFPDISFGILTGDIKDNPEADVLIMTTEILCNYLHNLKHSDSKLEFNIDIESELGCVIFDEVHYINDADRGTVWEECFILLPSHIQLVMLSATIATPDKFAKWVESTNPDSDKKVVLCETTLRAVPLHHHMWITHNTSIFNEKSKYYVKELTNLTESNGNKLVSLYDPKSGFNHENYNKISKISNYLDCNFMVKRQHVLNSVVSHLQNNQMLPAICFVYSRKNVEIYAKEINASLLDSKKINSVEKECYAILKKFPNYNEYIELPEYNSIVKLIEKGIGIHHSGLLPVFREMIEILFTKGYIQLLFATETFAVGLNMPTKTVLFTSLKKFDGRSMRYLMAHEYTQQAGRAGRRGYDKIGHVIHLNNMFEIPQRDEYVTILNNRPQTIVSRFKISYSLVLNSENPEDIIGKSAIHSEICKEIAYYERENADILQEINNLESQLSASQIPKTHLMSIVELENSLPYFKNKARKNKQRELEGLYDTYKNSQKYIEIYKKIIDLQKKSETLEIGIESTKNYVMTQVQAIKTILEDNQFTEKRADIARNIKEVHPLMMTDVFHNKLDFADVQQIVALLSCFTNINVDESVKNISSITNDREINNLIEYAKKRLDYYYNEEVRVNIFSGADYDIHYDLCDVMVEWCNCKTNEECIAFINKLKNTKNIFLGEFVKAVLKINAISKELEKICEEIGNTQLQHVLQQVGHNVLKGVCTSQSLYI